MLVERMIDRASLVAVICAAVALAVPGRPGQATPQAKPAQPQAAPAKKAVGQAGGKSARQAPDHAAAVPKSGQQVFKNLQVLQRYSREQVLDGMEYIGIALGARCDFCHDTKDYANDDNKDEQTARQMMKMLFAIDKDNFKDQPRVSCFSCHQGRHEPAIAPLPPDPEGPEPPAGPAMARATPTSPSAGTAIPTVEAVVAKYKSALGGDNGAAPTSLILQAEINPGGNRHVTSAEQIYEKAPNKILVVARGEQGPYSTGFDGTKAWMSTDAGTTELAGLQALLITRAAQLNPAGALDALTDKRLTGVVQLGDRQAWVVVGKAPDGNIDQFYFDTETGLLLRRAIVYRTIFGELLYAIYYKDYRKENGIEFPFQTDWWAGGQGWTETIKSIQVNAPVTDAQFEPPPSKPAQPAKPAASSPQAPH